MAFGGRSEKAGVKKKRSRRSWAPRKKVCKVCTVQGTEIDYLNVRVLQHFISERGRVIPRRVSGTCARHQREVVHAVKQARHIALIPYVASSHAGA